MTRVTIGAGLAILGLAWGEGCTCGAPKPPPGYQPPRVDRLENRVLKAGRPKIGPGAGVWDLEFTPDGATLVVCGPGGLEFMDARTLATIQSHDPPRAVRLSVHPSGKVVALGQRGVIEIRTIPDARPVQRITLQDLDPETAPPDDFMHVDPLFSPDGRYLAAWVRNDHRDRRKVWLYETGSWSFIRTVHDESPEHGIGGILFSVDATEVGVSHALRPRPLRMLSETEQRFNGGVQFYSLATGAPTRLFHGKASGPTVAVSWFSFTADGRLAIGCTDLGPLNSEKYCPSIWSLERPADPEVFASVEAERWTSDPFPGAYSVASVTPAGGVFIMAGSYVALWDVVAHRTFLLADLPQEGRVLAVAPDSKTAALVVGESTILLLDVTRKRGPASGNPPRSE